MMSLLLKFPDTHQSLFMLTLYNIKND